MLTHDQIWGALDSIAQSKSISVSQLAIVSGLDSTAFNKSKRIDTNGKLRYPSTHTLAKVLNKNNITIAAFAKICEQVK
ncbi:MAG: hypothetical protein IJY99_01705 [Alphaproteobacteria bacterium]|nr:hypothetical protein [Alphaproteobacteria bacterium]